MKFIFIAISILLSTGCGHDSSDPTNEISNIWNEDSQRIVIERFNGWTPDSNLRYTTFDYSRDMLTDETLLFLSEIVTTVADEVCVADGKSYDVTITDSSGLDHDYYSNNKHCNDSGRDKAIDIEELDELIVLLQ